MQAGFTNATLNFGLGIQFNAEKSWSVGVDKIMHMVTYAPVVQFSIGPVPFCMWFEVPVEMNMDATLQASAEAEAGVNAVYTIGSNLVTWDPKNHWVHTKPDPKFHMTEHASGDANFDASAHAALIPSISMHVNNLFTYTLTLNPQYNFDINGDTKTK